MKEQRGKPYTSNSRKVTVLVMIFVVGWFLYLLDGRNLFSSLPLGAKSGITINVRGDEQYVEKTRAQTVCGLLDEIGVERAETDRVTPSCDEGLEPGMEVRVASERVIKLIADGGEKLLRHYGGETFAEVAERHDVEIGERDFTLPDDTSILEDGAEVSLTRVTEADITETEEIAFEETVEEDDKEEEGYESVTQEGKIGEREVTYRVTYYDGEEITKEEVSQEVIKEKIDQVVVKGTRLRQDSGVATEDVELGKSHTGQASWYAYKDCDCAANPWLPKGSRVKVTAVNSGRSVIVTINDRGPFVPGRIIDLDVTAFEKIAPKGAGVIDIEMEEVVE